VRSLIPGGASRYEEVVVRGTLTPVRAGLAELQLEHVSIRGIPMPGDLIAGSPVEATGKGK